MAEKATVAGSLSWPSSTVLRGPISATSASSRLLMATYRAAGTAKRHAGHDKLLGPTATAAHTHATASLAASYTNTSELASAPLRGPAARASNTLAAKSTSEASSASAGPSLIDAERKIPVQLNGSLMVSSVMAVLVLLLVLPVALGAAPFTEMFDFSPLGQAPAVFDGSRVALHDANGVIHVYEAAANASAWVLQTTLHGLPPGETGLGLAMRGYFVAAGSTTGSRLWSLDGSARLGPVWADGRPCFGVAVSAQGTLVCGAESAAQGSVINVFERLASGGLQWELFEALTLANVTAPVLFGRTLALSSNVLLAGAVWDGSRDEGSVRVYTRAQSARSPFLLAATFRGTDGGQEFGAGLAIAPSQTRIAVGGHYDGGVHVFDFLGGTLWAHTMTVTSSAPHMGFNVGFTRDDQLIALAEKTATIFSLGADNATAQQSIALDPPLAIWRYVPALTAAPQAFLLANPPRVLLYATENATFAPGPFGPGRVPSGLEPWQVALIVLGSLLGAAVLGALLVVLVRRTRLSRRAEYDTL